MVKEYAKNVGNAQNHIDQNRTFDTDADMMALFRRIYYNAHWDRFVWWLKDNPNYDTAIPEVFLETEKFCFLVSEWLRKEKI
jgi:hypothetical protein